MTAEEYFAIDAMNASKIVPGLKSMLHMKHYADHGMKASHAMDMGTYIHAAILEEHLFWERCAVWPRAKTGAAYQAFKAKHDGKWIVSTPEYDHIQGAVEAVYRNTDAKNLLRDAAKELVVQWEDELCGPAKAKIDFAGFADWGCVKTTGNISEHARVKVAYDLAYDIKLAWYRRGVASKNDGRGLNCHVIWVEQGPPHDVVVQTMPASYMDIGERRLTRVLEGYTDIDGTVHHGWMSSNRCGIYLGVAEGQVTDLEPPRWVTGGEPVKLIDDETGEVDLV